MRTHFSNLFASDGPSRCAIRENLVEHGVAAFPTADFSLVENEFIKAGFLSVDRINTGSSNDWNLDFPTPEAIGQLKAGKRTER